MQVEVFDILVISYAVVHLHLQYRYWIRKDTNVFAKYCGQGRSYEYVSKWVYFTKVTWMIVLVLLQYLGLAFRPALVYSFLMYAIELQLLFPSGNIYNMLNLLLAVGAVIEDCVPRFA